MIKKFICLSLVLICLLSIFAFSAGAAQNIADTYITIQDVQNSGGTPYISSVYRRKYNSTSVWCENYSSSGGSAKCWVHRLSGNVNSMMIDTPSTGNANRVDRYYGGTLPYNGPSNSKVLPKGTYYYLPNYVNEDGYTHAALGFIMIKEKVYYKFGWSPDSI